MYRYKKIENQKLVTKLLFVIFHSDLEGGGSSEGREDAGVTVRKGSVDSCEADSSADCSANVGTDSTVDGRVHKWWFG